MRPPYAAAETIPQQQQQQQTILQDPHHQQQQQHHLNHHMMPAPTIPYGPPSSMYAPPPYIPMAPTPTFQHPDMMHHHHMPTAAHMQGMPAHMHAMTPTVMPQMPSSSMAPTPTLVTTPASSSRAKKAKNKEAIPAPTHNKEEIIKAQKQYQLQVESRRTRMKHTKVLNKRKLDQFFAEEDALLPNMHSPNAFSFKRRKLNPKHEDDDDDTAPEDDVLEAENLLQRVIQQTNQMLITTNEDDAQSAHLYFEQHRATLLKFMTNKDFGEIEMFELKKFVKSSRYFQPVYRVLEAISDKVKSHPSLLYVLPSTEASSLSTEQSVLPGKSNVTLIDMTPQEIMMVFVGKADGNEKQEEVQGFLDRFTQLQNEYREQADYIKQSKIAWHQQYRTLLQEQSEVRPVTEAEKSTMEARVEAKFEQLLTQLKDKYMAEVYALQENILMRSKKRGNLPKNATNGT